VSATLKIFIDSDNAAFADAPRHELARITRQALHHLENATTSRDKHSLKDINGNTVGCITWTVEEELE